MLVGAETRGYRGRGGCGGTNPHCRITEKLGEGGMGGVDAATGTKLDRPVALGLLPPSYPEPPKPANISLTLDGLVTHW